VGRHQLRVGLHRLQNHLRRPIDHPS
jgi:hypothetical protein